MKLKYKIFLGLLCGLCICDAAQAQNASLNACQEILGDTLIFRFAPKKNMFWADYKGNRESIQTMTELLRTNKSFIESGDIKVRVLGFCSSYGSVKENLAAAKNRSNQVKSYFIVQEGLKEEHFRTTNSTRRWKGLTDVIAVAYLFETGAQEPSTPSESLQDTTRSVDRGLGPDESLPKDTTETKADSLQQPDRLSAEPEKPADSQESAISQTVPQAETVEKERPYRWAIKTNVAYLAATVANLGIEYSFGEHYSIDFPIIYSPYTVARNYCLRLFAVQPEFRYWLRNPMQGHFFGVHMNVGRFNIAVNSKTRYQSSGLYGVGLSYGYMLPFARRWAAEFTIGAGYVYTKYDSFYNIPNGAYDERGVPYNYWGLTKVGIGLVYRFGK